MANSTVSTRRRPVSAKAGRPSTATNTPKAVQQEIPLPPVEDDADAISEAEALQAAADEAEFEAMVKASRDSAVPQTIVVPQTTAVPQASDVATEVARQLEPLTGLITSLVETVEALKRQPAQSAGVVEAAPTFERGGYRDDRVSLSEMRGRGGKSSNPFAGNVLFHYDPSASDQRKSRTQALLMVAVPKQLPPNQHHFTGTDTVYEFKGLIPGVQEISRDEAEGIMNHPGELTQEIIERGVIGPWADTSDIRVIFERDPQKALQAIRLTRSVNLLTKWAKFYLELSPALQEALRERQTELKAEASAGVMDIFGTAIDNR
jgi:hypothetical protein